MHSINSSKRTTVNKHVMAVLKPRVRNFMAKIFRKFHLRWWLCNRELTGGRSVLWVTSRRMKIFDAPLTESWRKRGKTNRTLVVLQNTTRTSPIPVIFGFLFTTTPFAAHGLLCRVGMESDVVTSLLGFWTPTLSHPRRAVGSGWYGNGPRSTWIAATGLTCVVLAYLQVISDGVVPTGLFTIFGGVP